MGNLPKPFDPFGALEDFDSEPAMPLTSVQRQRWTQMAADLQDTRIQGYIEANFGLQVLRLLQAIVPILAGMVP